MATEASKTGQFRTGSAWTGNRRGRPKKGTAVADLLRYVGDLRYHGEAVTYRERAAEVVWELACAGSLEAIKWIVERTEGKPADRVELSGTLSHEHHDRLTDQERTERLAALFALFGQDAGRPDHGGAPLALAPPGGAADAGVPQ